MSPLDGSDWGRSAISCQGANIFLGIWGKQVFSIDLKTGKVRWVNNQLRFMEQLQVSRCDRYVLVTENLDDLESNLKRAGVWRLSAATGRALNYFAAHNIWVSPCGEYSMMSMYDGTYQLLDRDFSIIESISCDYLNFGGCIIRGNYIFQDCFFDGVRVFSLRPFREISVESFGLDCIQGLWNINNSVVIRNDSTWYDADIEAASVSLRFKAKKSIYGDRVSQSSFIISNQGYMIDIATGFIVKRCRALGPPPKKTFGDWFRRAAPTSVRRRDGKKSLNMPKTTCNSLI
jgi:hypothetical protein